MCYSQNGIVKNKNKKYIYMSLEDKLRGLDIP